MHQKAYGSPDYLPKPKQFSENPEPQIPAPKNQDDTWKLKLRILRQRLTEQLSDLQRDDYDNPEIAAWAEGVEDSIETLDEMLGQTEEERLKLYGMG